MTIKNLLNKIHPTLGAKLTSGMLILTLLMLAAAFAGLHGVSRLENLLSFLTGPAWLSANNSAGTSLTVQRQVWTMSEFTGGRVSMAAVMSKMRRMGVIIDGEINNIEESGLVPETKLASFRGVRNEFAQAAEQLHGKYKEHADRAVAFRAGFTVLGDYIDRLIVLGGDNETTILKMWNTLLERVRLYMEMRLEPQRIAGNLDRLDALGDEIDRQSAHLAKLPGYRNKITEGRFAGQGYYQVLQQLLNAHQEQLAGVVKAYTGMHAANQAYQGTADRLLKVAEEVQDIGEEEMISQGPAVAAAKTRAHSTVMLVVVIGLVVAVVLAFYLTRQIRSAFRKVVDVSERMQRGDLDTISVEKTGDEVEHMMTAMKGMVDALDERNDQLNDSVIELLKSVFQLSQRDLTARARVTEDVTGPVADAVNMMVSETSKVLWTIKQVSDEVERAANTVKAQSEKVTDVAKEERLMVESTAEGLQRSSTAMVQLAKGAYSANTTAGKAMKHTKSALDAVENTIEGIEQIRDIIRETEKRMKRLGERSQEINSAVNLINTIADRTHILALNASMHAASAGEAGRGFAVVADEVQRLAESSREATSDIASMVNNIRIETADTVNTMNKVITQVAEGTRLALDAGKRMQETEETTTKLVEVVQRIAASASNQARVATQIAKRSQTIVKSTELTGEELRAQAEHTENLVQFSSALRESVGTFKLPEGDQTVSGAA